MYKCAHAFTHTSNVHECVFIIYEHYALRTQTKHLGNRLGKVLTHSNKTVRKQHELRIIGTHYNYRHSNETFRKQHDCAIRALRVTGTHYNYRKHPTTHYGYVCTHARTAAYSGPMYELRQGSLRMSTADGPAHG